MFLKRNIGGIEVKVRGWGTGCSGGSTNRGPELLEPPSSGAREKF